MRQATFSIRKVIQNGYTFYSIYTPAYLSPTGKKHYQYFGTKAEAERKRAELIASTRTESKITDLSNVQIRDAQRALERLAEHGLELTLDRAIELALPVLRSSGRKITVDQLFQDFATAKQNDWSDVSKRAFNTSAKTFLRRWSGTLISTIDGDDLETWYNSTFPSSGYRAHELRTIRPAFSWAVRKNSFKNPPTPAWRVSESNANPSPSTRQRKQIVSCTTFSSLESGGTCTRSHGLRPIISASSAQLKAALSTYNPCITVF